MDQNESNAIRGMTAKLEAMEEAVFNMTAQLQDISQRLKVVQFSVGKGIDASAHLPKGEGDSFNCQDCGRRVKREDMMKKTRSVGRDLVVFDTCKSCFYERNK